jgi:hypothetical protein
MNPIVLQFANGNVFFVGIAMVAGVITLCLRRNGRILRSIATITWLVGIALVILSATPLPEWTYAVWLVVCLVGFVAVDRRAKIDVREPWRCAVAAISLLASLALVLMELPHHLSPSIEVSSARPVFVIGDSISAGIDSKERAWPEVLG